MADPDNHAGDEGDEIARMQHGVRDWVRRSTQAGEGTLRRASPTALLSVLCASAVSPLLAAGAGLTNPFAAAGVGVLSSVSGGVLGAVITEALDGLRGGDSPSQQEVTDEVASHIQRAVTAGDADAHLLLAEIADVLREIDAGGTALRAAIEVGGQRISDDITVALGEIGTSFAELGFLLRHVAAAAAEIQRTLDEQGAAVRGIIELNYRQSTEIRLAREVLALIEARTRLGPVPAGGPPRWLHGSPYRGLLPFEATDEPVFYGRERLTAELGVRVTGGGLIVVTGASGAGKSSLLRAGLVPMLARGQQVAGSASWPVRLLTPTADPVTELAVTLAVLGGGGSTAPIRDAIMRAPQDAHLLVREAVAAEAIRRAEDGPVPTGDQARLVLVVDQFEQVFTLSPDAEHARAAFITALCSAATGADDPGGRPRAVVVLAVRGDFWDRCAAYPPLASQLQEGQFVVGPMTPAELRLAITGPAEAAGLSIDPALTEAIMADLDAAGGTTAGGTVAGGTVAGALPLLSQAMLLTWRNRESDRLTHRGYAQSGGVGLAVQTSADAVYQSLTPPQQLLARRMLRALTVAGRDGRFTRRPLSRPDLRAACPQASEPELDAVLEAFAASRLIVLNDGTAQLAHDALLWAWPKLRDWLAEDQASWVLYAQLADTAARWRDGGDDPSFLFRGAQLAAVAEAAAQWAGDPGRFPASTPAEQDFLRASSRAAARAARQRQFVAAALVVLLVAALAGAAVAVRAAHTADVQQRLASRQRDAAVSAQFAAQSEALDGSNPVEAAQLAAAAWRLSPQPQARDSLLDVYAQPDHGDLVAGGGGVTAVAFSPHGGLLATGSMNGSVSLWRVATRQRLGPSMKVRIYASALGQGGVTSAAFSPNGKFLVTAGSGGVVQFWSVARHRQVGATIDVPGGQSIGELAFNPAGTIIATADLDGTVRLWSAATRQEMGPPIAVAGSAAQVTFSPDGSLLATGNSEGVVQLWRVSTHRQVGARLGTAGAEASALAFSPDGKLLAIVGTSNDTARLWRVATHRPVGPPLDDDGVTSVAFSPDGTLLATADLEGQARLWDVATRQPVGPAIAVGAAISAVAFSPDGSFLATGDQDGTARLLSVTAFRQLGAPLAVGGQVYDVQFSPDGRLVATAGDNGVVQLWKAATQRPAGPPIVVTPPLAEAGANAVAFSPGGGLLATGDGNGVTRLWSVTSHRQVGAPMKVTTEGGPGNFNGVEAMAFSRSGRLLATAEADGTVRIWSVRTHRQVGGPIDAENPSSNPNVYAVAFSPDGRLLATSAEDGTVRFWSVDTHREIGGPVRLGSQVTPGPLAFSPGGSRLAVGDDQGTVRFFSVATHREVGEVLTQGGTVEAIAFSRNGTILATADSDGSGRLWDVTTGQQIGPPLHADGAIVYAVAFSPDNGLLATASQDGFARLWDVAFPPDLPRAVCVIAGEEPLTRPEWHSFTSSAPYQRTCP